MEQYRDPPQQRRAAFIENLHEAAFSLNIASALGVTVFICVVMNMIELSPKSDLGYHYLRAAVRINDFLHVRMVNVVTTRTLSRQESGPWEQIGQELAILVTVISVAAVLLFILRLLAGRWAQGLTFNRVSVMAALFAAPACFLYVWRVRFRSVSNPYGLWQFGPSHLMQGILLAIIAAEILYACTQAFQGGPLHISTRGLNVLLFFLHYGFWTSIMWKEMPDWFTPHFTPYLLLLASPLSGIAWLLHQKYPRAHEIARDGKTVCKWGVASAIVSMSVLFAIWHPGTAFSLAQTKDLKSLRLEISRGACRGRCPVYTVTVRGDGSVEYVGYHNVRVQGPQTATITKEQLTQILRKLDSVQFSTIEDRAFKWGFDSASIEVSVSIDGRTKRVVSDEMRFASDNGQQVQFVRAANEIDNMVVSERWVR